MKDPDQSAKSADCKLHLNTHASGVCCFAGSDIVNTCMVAGYTQNVRRDGSSCMWHQPFNIQPCGAVSTPLRWIFKTALQSLIQNYMRQELRESARKQRIALYKSDQQQQSLCDLCAAAGPGSQEEANSVEAANSRNMLLLCDITVECLCSYVPSHCLRRQTKECILSQLLRRPGHSYTLMELRTAQSVLGTSYAVKSLGCFPIAVFWVKF